MPTYASLIKVRDRNVQNVQEMATIWGDIRSEIEEFDAKLLHSYAVLGDYDFIVIFEAADNDEAFKAALTVERHGLDGQTMEVVPIEKFADLASDI